jgi:hypothetical protein
MNVQKKADSVMAKMMKPTPNLFFKLGDVVLIPLAMLIAPRWRTVQILLALLF